jgi:hypothetical protein
MTLLEAVHNMCLSTFNRQDCTIDQGLRNILNKAPVLIEEVAMSIQ